MASRATRPAVSTRKLIPMAEAADYLCISDRTIRRYISAGILKAYRVGPRLIKVDLADIEAILNPTGGAA